MSVYYSRPRTPSIGNHLFLLALGTLLPVVLFAAGLAVVQARQERRTFELGMHDRVVAITSAIDAELRSTVGALRTLAASQALARDDLQTFYGFALRVKNAHPDWVTVILAGADGLQQVNAMRPYGAELLPIDETASFEAVLRTLQPAIGSLSSGPRGLRQAFPIRVPVLREGQLAYVLTAVVDPAAISRILREQGMPDDWVASVVDRKLLQVARQFQGQVQVGVAVAPDFHAALTSGAAQGAYRGATLEGTPAYVTWRQSAFSGWSVGIGVPAKSVEASAWRALVIGLLGVGVSLALALLLARLLARRISEPVALLAAQARALRRSEYSLSLQHTQPEIPSLPPPDEQPAPTDAAQRDDAAPGRANLSIPELRELQFALDDAAQAMHVLGRARAQAESTNRAKDQFLAMLGHEIRNPLAAISGAAAVLGNAGLDPSASTRYLQIFRRQSSHLGHIVNDLLDVSRLVAGKIVLERHPLDLAACVTGCVEALRATEGAASHGIAVDASPVWVDGDAARIEQIVNNLITNALKFSPPRSEVQVKVGIEGGRAVVAISDRGSGMTPELLQHVFEPFVQGPPPANSAQSGLGIGLALVQQLVKLHGGEVEAVSGGPGQGSTFCFCMPIVEARLGEPAPRDTPLRADRKIVLVEDNADARATMGDLLRVFGYRIIEVADGAGALPAVLAAQPDLVITDIGLPDIDGYEVARRLRAEPATRTVPLIALTGYGRLGDKEAARLAGFDAHLVKPVDPDALVETIECLLANR